MMTRSRFIVQPDWAGKPREAEIDGWPVIDGFEPPEKDYTAGLSDLSHRPKATVYGPALKKQGELEPGKAIWTGQGFLSLLRPGEAVVFDLLGPMNPSWPEDATDMTDAWVLLGLWGRQAVAVMERLFAVDVDRPGEAHPFHLVTRWHALVVQILNLKGLQPGFLLATDRSHGQNLFDGLIHGGRHLGLRPVGVRSWQDWFGTLGFN